MVRCFFCRVEGFADLDSASVHQYSLTSEGHPACPVMDIEFLVKVDSTDKWFGKNGQYYRDREIYVPTK